jgi:uncharacterized protein YodC (DUF2158 family)
MTTTDKIIDDWLKSVGYEGKAHGSMAGIYPEDVTRLKEALPNYPRPSGAIRAADLSPVMFGAAVRLKTGGPVMMVTIVDPIARQLGVAWADYPGSLAVKWCDPEQLVLLALSQS